MFQRPNERLSWVCVSKSSNNCDKDDAIQCEFCDGKFDETELPAHQKFSHKDEIKNKMLKNGESFCGTCFKSFPTRSDLIKHTLSSHLNSSEDAIRIQHEIYACDHCQQIFFTKLTLTNHIIFRHLHKKSTKSTIMVKCHYCKKTIPMLYYHVHKIKHASAVYSIYCFKCDSKFKNQTSFKEHFQTHPKHYYCDICKYSCDRETTFHMHVQMHRDSVKIPSMEENIERFFITPYITDVWAMTKSLFFSGVWLPVDVNVCVFCRELCYSEIEMRKHIQSHKPVDQKKHTCACGEVFSSKILLKQHEFQGHSTKAIPGLTRRKSIETSIEPLEAPSNIKECEDSIDPKQNGGSLNSKDDFNNDMIEVNVNECVTVFEDDLED